MPVFNNVTTYEVTSELVIGQFKPSDQATYTCVARNMYNDEEKTSTNIGNGRLLIHLFQPSLWDSFQPSGLENLQTLAINLVLKKKKQ